MLSDATGHGVSKAQASSHVLGTYNVSDFVRHASSDLALAPATGVSSELVVAAVPPTITKVLEVFLSHQIDGLGECLSVCASRSRTLKLLGFEHLHFDSRIQEYLMQKARCLAYLVLEMLFLARCFHGFREVVRRISLWRQLQHSQRRLRAQLLQLRELAAHCWQSKKAWRAQNWRHADQMVRASEAGSRFLVFIAWWNVAVLGKAMLSSRRNACIAMGKVGLRLDERLLHISFGLWHDRALRATRRIAISSCIERYAVDAKDEVAKLLTFYFWCHEAMCCRLHCVGARIVREHLHCVQATLTHEIDRGRLQRRQFADITFTLCSQSFIRQLLDRWCDAARRSRSTRSQAGLQVVKGSLACRYDWALVAECLGVWVDQKRKRTRTERASHFVRQCMTRPYDQALLAGCLVAWMEQRLKQKRKRSRIDKAYRALVTRYDCALVAECLVPWIKLRQKSVRAEKASLFVLQCMTRPSDQAFLAGCLVAWMEHRRKSLRTSQASRFVWQCIARQERCLLGEVFSCWMDDKKAKRHKDSAFRTKQSYILRQIAGQDQALLLELCSFWFGVKRTRHRRVTRAGLLTRNIEGLTELFKLDYFMTWAQIVLMGSLARLRRKVFCLSCSHRACLANLELHIALLEAAFLQACFSNWRHAACLQISEASMAGYRKRWQGQGTTVAMRYFLSVQTDLICSCFLAWQSFRCAAVSLRKLMAMIILVWRQRACESKMVRIRKRALTNGERTADNLFRHRADAHFLQCLYGWCMRALNRPLDCTLLLHAALG